MEPLEGDIAELKSWLDAANPAEAAAVAVRILRTVESGKVRFGASGTGSAGARLQATELAAALQRLLSNPAWAPPARIVRAFLLYKRAVSHVFETGDQRGTQGLVGSIGAAAAAGQQSALLRLVMGISVNAAPPWLPRQLGLLPPAIRLLTVLAFLSEYLNWSADAERARNALVQIGDLPERAALQSGEWPLLASAWMACSYAQSPHRHDIKAPLNRVVRNWLLSRNVREAPPRDAAAPAKQRPTLLIVNEIWYTGHAMDRCYRASIRALRRRFRTVFMCVTDMDRPVDVSLYDEVDRTTFAPERPEEFLARARAYDPDVLYLPSVGMRIGGIASANVRLAPVQIATNGHPATTRSPCVDYMILPEGAVAGPERFSETVLLRPPGPYYVAPAQRSREVAPDIRHHPSPVLLAVPAWIRKVTPRFLHTCRLIAQRAERPVQFRFFPILRASAYQAARRRLRHELSAEVLPWLPYGDYLDRLNECDIHLSTFPFGSSNGIVDSALQGLPVVSLLGDEPHNRLDASLARMLGQPDWLTASSVEEYVDAVVRLVDDDKLRVEISEAILAADPASRLLLDDDAETAYFADMVDAAYRHHEQIRESGRRVWSCADLLALGAGQAGKRESR